MRLENKVALITGAGSGIGCATAKLFAQEGVRVVVADYNAESGQATVTSIKNAGGQAVFVHADVSQAADAERMVKVAADTYGRLDVVHNNAGIFVKPTPAHEMTEEVWDRVFDINIKGVWLGCKYAIPELIKAGGGAIVNTASMAGIRGRPYTSAYCASKGAVVMFTKTLAIELSPYNIRVKLRLPRSCQYATDSSARDHAGTSRRADVDGSADRAVRVPRRNRTGGSISSLGCRIQLRDRACTADRRWSMGGCHRRPAALNPSAVS
jgi:NAD(P)-dependent dehydrogenase (short-subunit alcohol dehydrogenase family)